MPPSAHLLVINQQDSVAVALTEIRRGDPFPPWELQAKEDIPAGHKIALRDISAGEPVLKYGCPIGNALGDIPKGSHVHTHNLKTRLEGILDYRYEPETARKAQAKPRTFKGYLRENGEAGIRNEIWVIPTVGCINKAAERIAAIANQRFAGKTDGIYAFTHPYGCSQMGEDQEITQRILAGLANNPNAAGVLLLGLGCENNQLSLFKPFLGQYNPRRVKFLVMQDAEDEIEESLALITQLASRAQQYKREELPVGMLKIGLNCGGSDGFSGISANPLVGRLSNQVIDQGGIALLTEVPEMFGAETILMNRCRSQDEFRQTVGLINDCKNYFIRYGQTIYENPSPGNKEGGISTLEEKSLGCIQKGGTRQVTAVLDYGQKAVAPGLALLTGPGNDIVANTSLAASGAQIILFTTGRGTPTGGPVPTVKISSNSRLAARKPHWIDFDAGALLGGTTMDQLADTFVEYVLSVASGEHRTKNEVNGYREISIFRDGVTL